MDEALINAVSNSIQNQHGNGSVDILSIEPLAHICNLNKGAVGNEFIKSKYSESRVTDYIGFSPVTVTYRFNKCVHRISIVIKGHKPGAFVNNLCPNTLQQSGIYLNKPYDNCFISKEFRCLSQGEYNYYPLHKLYAESQHLIPKFYGRYCDFNNQCNYVFIELVTPIENLNQWQQACRWSDSHYHIVIDGLAQLHSTFLGKNKLAELSKPWLAGPFSSHDFADDSRLWLDMHRRLTEYFPDWCTKQSQQLHRHLVSTIEQWWQPCYESSPKTIVHGDFNPRNIGFTRNAQNQLQLLALDWECVRWGLPQLDLVEFILHSCKPESTVEYMNYYSELMRQRLGAYSQMHLDKALWEKGIIASIAYHMLNRAPLLALMARIYMPNMANFGLFMYRNASTYFAYALNPSKSNR